MMKHQNTASIDEQILVKFVEGRTTLEETAAIIEHIRSCKFCMDVIRFLYSALIAEKNEELPHLSRSERKQVCVFLNQCMLHQTICEESPVWQVVFTRLEELLSEKNSTEFPEVLAASADKKLYFTSSCPKYSPNYWMASVELPNLPDDEKVLKFTLSNASGHPISSGTLYFCGLGITIDNGTGTLSLEKFQTNLSKGSISFTFANGTSSEGAPVLGTLL